MCLTVDDKRTQEFKKGNPTEMTVWKVYQIKEGGVYPPLQHHGGYLAPGSICSNRPVTTYPFLPDWEVAMNRGLIADHVGQYKDDRVFIESGIHVCLTRKDARKYKKSLEFSWNQQHKILKSNYIIFKCVAHSNNLVAFGRTEFYGTHPNSAVFTKIYIGTIDWHKALKKDFR